jgi:lipopolysaccharide exporter
MTTVRRALAISFLERYLTVALALASNMLLARLLTPHEIGVYSVSLAVIGVAQVLREFGIGNYLIQEKQLTDDHLRTAFGISVLLGGTLFVAVVAVAPYAARFYNEPAMAQTLRIAALNFLVLPFCTVRLALLRRAMRFKALLYVSLVATVLSQIVTVGLAWAGLGPDSMAIGSVVLNVAMAVGTFVAHDDKRVLAPSLKLWRPLLNFGGQSALTNMVTSVSMDASDLIVAKVMGFGPVAMLSRAQGLMNLFHRDVMGAVRNVAFPALAEAHRRGSDLVPVFARSMALLTLAAWCFYGLVGLYGLEALRLLFGTQWDAARPLVSIFCAAGAVAILNSLVPTLLTAIGRIDLVTRMELVIQPARLALIAAAAITFRTMEAVAWAYLIMTLFTAPFFLFVAARGLPGLIRPLWGPLARSALVALVACLPALWHVSQAGLDRTAPVNLAAAVLYAGLGLALGLLTAVLVGHPLRQEPALHRAFRSWWPPSSAKR